MPPKKATNEPSKKTVEKTKTKIIEDKTFGLKNKKGAKQQKFIENVQKQVTQGNKTLKEKQSDKTQAEKAAQKEDKLKQLDELAKLFKPVVETQKLEHGVDPKSVLCIFFKQNLCRKPADKCKFSHDPDVARKSSKRVVYEINGGNDQDPSCSNTTDNMENWDQEKLEEVVNKKHGDKNSTVLPTTIICKFFLSAVEENKYGWFWECPNGDKCHYRHALPPDFVLKKDRLKPGDQEEKISIEELIENERAALGPNQTKVTFETFMKWKKRKKTELIAKMENQKAERAANFRQGKTLGISGREMFEFNPDFVREEDDEVVGGGTAVVDSTCREAEDDYSGPIRVIGFEDFALSVEGDAADDCAVVEVDESLFKMEEMADLLDDLEDAELS